MIPYCDIVIIKTSILQAHKHIIKHLLCLL